MDEVTALKLENDSYRSGNCELNKNLELAQARIEDPKNEVVMENAITLLKEELSTNILSLKKELNSSINNKFIELQENLKFQSKDNKESMNQTPGKSYSEMAKRSKDVIILNRKKHWNPRNQLS
ncbi:hypothetical protein Zmor_021795 [Zophobas morio]|uniref:Uncharacterized protein n=1 Tax=Zophobas morio TaxID=2755281 RepID=A0AA38I6D7_9CUCU|nr:hypothetical protein Zmor_021795 [Zophobas morio]